MPLSMGAAKSPPFSLSGSWEADLEGWTVSPVNVVRDSYAARTGTYGIAFYDDGYIQYVLPASQVSGLTINVSLWNLNYSSGVRSLQYRIGSWSFVDIVPNAAVPSNWTFVSGSFFSPGQEDVTIRLTATGVDEYVVDDWEISGT